MGTTNFVNLLDQISVSLRIKWREMRHEGFTSRPLLVAFPRISGLGVAFLAGWTADRFGARRTMGGVLLLTGIMTALLSVTWGYWIVVVVFLQPMVAVCFFPAGFATLSRIGLSSARNVGVSLTIPVAFLLGAGAIPTVIGVMGDVGSFALGLALVGGLILTGFVL